MTQLEFKFKNPVPKSKLIELRCPRCGKILAEVIKGMSCWCKDCQVWVTSRDGGEGNDNFLKKSY